MGNQVEDTEPTMVEQLPITLEWQLNVHSTRNGRMQTPSSRTPMPRLLRIWCLHGWCLVQRRLAATPAATQALHTVAGTTRHRGSSSHLGPSPGWTAHEVSLRQPAHSPVMDQPVFKAPWHNGSPKKPVRYCSQKQLYSFPGAPPRHTEVHCGRTFPQSKCHASFPLPPKPTSCPRLYLGAGSALERRLRHLLHRTMAPTTFTTYRAGIRKYYAFCTPAPVSGQ